MHPDWITVFGLLAGRHGSGSSALANFLTGGVVLLLSLPLDALDGAVARAAQRGQGAFGMVLDSTLDRYADGFIFAAFGYYFAESGRLDMLVAALAALMGSYLVSYVRARADDAKVNVSVTVGWFSRLERVVALLMMTLAAGLCLRLWRRWRSACLSWRSARQLTRRCSGCAMYIPHFERPR